MHVELGVSISESTEIEGAREQGPRENICK
jgi:hypothetical protein